MRNAVVATIALLAAPAAGCLGGPFITPPVRVAAGAAGFVGERPARAAPLPPPAPADPVVASVSITVEPFAWIPALMSRPFELAAGWTMESAGGISRPVHALELHTGWVLFAAGLSRALPPESRPVHAALRPIPSARECGGHGSCARLTARAHGGALVMPGDLSIGYRFGVQLTAELSVFTRAAGGYITADGEGVFGVAGVAWGETAIGLFVDASQSGYGNDTWWQFGGGLTVRFPSSVGVGGLVCFSCFRSLSSIKF